MAHGFTKQHIIDGIVRDDNAASPATFENNLVATSAATRIGTTLTAHVTPHTKATTYTTLIASTAQIANGIWVAAFNVAQATTATEMLMDIAKGAAASEVNIVQNIDLGAAAPAAGAVNGMKLYYFPGITIPAGTRISARIQALITVDTVDVAIWLDYRAQWQIANAAWVTYGANTAASDGTSVPQGANAFGAWTSIGTTSRNHNLWSVGFDLLADTTQANITALLIEIGYGPNAASVTSIGVVQAFANTSEFVSGCFPPVLTFSVASGSGLWARIAGADTENRGVIIYGN
jgi:hypothetical protein